MDVTHATLRLNLDPPRTIAVDMLERFSGRRRLMKNPLSSPDALSEAAAALEASKAPVTVINDPTGFVVQRLLAMIVNVGTRIAELRIAACARARRA